MKKILSVLLIMVLVASCVWAYTPLTRIRNFVNDKNNGVPITSSYMDSELNQLVSAANGTLVVQGSAPSSPYNGEFWYDSTNKVLKEYRNNEWIVHSAVHGSISLPTTGQKGDLYVNWSSFPSLQEYDGTNWQALIPLTTSGTNWASINSIGKLNAGAVNWQNFTSNNLPYQGINWISIPGDASGNFVKSNGNNTVSMTAISLSSLIGSYSAGTYPLLGSWTSEVVVGASGPASFTKVAEVYLPRSGTLTVKFWGGGDGTGTRSYRIYRNGSAVGTTQTVSTNTFTQFSEDISGWSAGDLLQLYQLSSDTSNNHNAYSGGLQVFASIPGSELLNLSIGNAGNYVWRGTGAPGGANTISTAVGSVGDFYLNVSGGASTTLYVKTGASTWTAK